MKIITNKKDSACVNCLSAGCAVIDKSGAVVCVNCGSKNLIDNQGEIFQPVFAAEKYYQASPYCPKRPDRRKVDKPWPLARERRATKLQAIRS
jgi:hypothetical protein